MDKRLFSIVLLVLILSPSAVLADTSDKLLEMYNIPVSESKEIEASKLIDMENKLNDKKYELDDKKLFKDVSTNAADKYVNMINTLDVSIYTAENNLISLEKELSNNSNSDPEKLFKICSLYDDEKNRLEKALSDREFYHHQVNALSSVPGVDMTEIKALQEKVEDQKEKTDKAVTYTELGDIENVKSPVQDKFLVTSSFGYRVHPVTLESSTFHRGVDLSAVIGDNVLAAFNGTVELISEDDISGKYIVLNHGNGIKTMYLHMNDINVKQGDIVNQYNMIGKAGGTGRVTGPHLHFGLYINGQPVDPAKIF